jgi:hypothetical protein
MEQSHSQYYELYKHLNFTNPARVYSKVERIKLNLPARITDNEIHRYLMLCYECRQAETSGLPIPDVALNEKHRIIWLAMERLINEKAAIKQPKKKGNCNELFDACYSGIFSVSRN